MTTMCMLDDLDGCDDSEKSFLAMMVDAGREGQVKALEPIKDADAIQKVTASVDPSMQWDLKRWLSQRRKILMMLLDEETAGDGSDGISDEL